MLLSRTVGEVRISQVIEYSGPTHQPDGLLPGLGRVQLEANRSLLVPNHWVPGVNKLIITIQLWIIHAGNHIIIVDTGVGNLKPRLAIKRMHMLNTLVLPWLEAVGAAPDRVTHVVQTHLHADHVGWNTTWSDERWVPTFPNARYFFPKDDFDFCRSGRNRVEGVDVFMDAFTDSVMPVVDAGLAEMIVPGAEIADCLVAEPAPGHSPGHTVFRLRSRGEQALFCGDTFHSPLQIVYPELNSNYCIWPGQAIATRRALLESAAATQALLLPVHFGAPYAGYVRKQDQGYLFEPALW